MNDIKSLTFIADFETRIQKAQTDKSQESFIRELIVDIAQDCPLPVLTELAICVLRLRKSELKKTSECN